ncbi:GDP-D-glucose phosphorylase 1-like [Mytilus trossulus]|uniref:GDP-D-glucose phosphorylase 1-like n=1 Tax=Mytilus trossulus TaxID=6551 RepID=UPI0030043F65
MLQTLQDSSDCFVYSENDLLKNCQLDKDYQLSEFDIQLRKSWDDKMKNGHFRYHLDKVETKIIPGSLKYVAQLNVKRATERRPPQNITIVNQPFDSKVFNFTKVKEDEIIFRLEKSDNDGQQQCNGHTDSKNEKRNIVMVNVSPLEYGHILICPDIDASKPQLLDEYALKLAINCQLLSKHKGFRLGFNSLCAFASVNHQHVHAYYLEQEIFAEKCPVQHLKGPVYELDVIPCKGFVFQLFGTTVDQLTKDVIKMTEYLQSNEVAHNVFITRGTAFGDNSKEDTIRIYVWPRAKFIGVKEEAAFNVAVVELAGHLPIKVEKLYEDLTEDLISDTVREAALPEEEYKNIKDNILKLYLS